MNENSAHWVRQRLKLQAARLSQVMPVLTAIGVISCQPGSEEADPLLRQMLASTQVPVTCPPRATEPGDTAHRFFRHIDGDSTLADWGREIAAFLGPDGRPHTIWITMSRQRPGASDTVVVLHGQFDRDSSGVVELLRGADDSIGIMISQGLRGDQVSPEVAARLRGFADGLWSDWCGRGS